MYVVNILYVCLYRAQLKNSLLMLPFNNFEKKCCGEMNGQHPQRLIFSRASSRASLGQVKDASNQWVMEVTG